jgi:DNA anti-recombination protein RmuC
VNTTEIFKNQINSGATEMWFYGIETLAEKVEDIRIDIKSHKGSLDTFPTNLEFVRMMTPSNPLFREGHRCWNEELFE